MSTSNLSKHPNVSLVQLLWDIWILSHFYSFVNINKEVICFYQKAPMSDVFIVLYGDLRSTWETWRFSCVFMSIYLQRRFVAADYSEYSLRFKVMVILKRSVEGPLDHQTLAVHPIIMHKYAIEEEFSKRTFSYSVMHR